MDQVETQLKILLEMLDNKIDCLNKILKSVENQNEFIRKGSYDYNEYRLETNTKLENLEKANSIDEVFVRVYAKIKRMIDQNNRLHKDLVAKLQDKIKEVTDLTVKIHVTEERNARLGDRILRRPQKSATLQKNAIESYVKQKKHRV